LSWLPHVTYAWDNIMDRPTARRVCELVAGIIATDRELHPAELRFMLKTFEAFGIANGKEDEAICPAVTSVEAAKAISDLPREVRAETMDLLIRSAAIDGKVVPAERKYLAAVARAVDVSEDSIEERIAEQLLALDREPPS
jgi:uncharacterized tellurite resistance protein B-like protein